MFHSAPCKKEGELSGCGKCPGGHVREGMGPKLDSAKTFCKELTCQCKSRTVVVTTALTVRSLLTCVCNDFFVDHDISVNKIYYYMWQLHGGLSTKATRGNSEVT